ncbi:MAG TPA: ABC transporter ATP-binding protein [Abditibacteriaceae bacterium]|jgi:ABC-type multidrug transport system fused ATPase/permease subunit
MHDNTQFPSTLQGFIWAKRQSFFGGLAFALGRIVVISPFPIIFKHIIDHLMPQKNLAGIVWVSALMIVLLAGHQWFMVKGASKLGKAIAHTVLHLRAQIFNKIQYLNFTYLDRQQAGRLLAKYAFDTQKIEGVIMPILNGFIPNSFYSLVTLTILISMNWQLSVVVFLMLPIMAFMRAHYFARLRVKNEENRVAQEKLTGNASEFFSALRLVRSYGEEKRAQSQLHATNKEVLRTRINLVEVSSSFGAFSWNAIQFLSLVVVAGGAALSIYGQVSSGTVLAFVAGLPSLVQPIQMFMQLSEQYFMGQESYNSIKELLGESDVEKWKGTQILQPIQGRIEFDQVSFRYPNADEDALKEFNLIIKPGEKVALVGSSGAGKSTVTSLLLGLYAAASGEIRIDGVPQAKLDMRWLRRNTAIVMQDSILLSGSIEDNIRFAREDASVEEVREAARLARAEEFILKMPDGFQTVIGERGVMLSGGQRQRISIARALLRNPVILILDEPTSALDYESERLIQEALDTLAEGRTVLTIAHRLSTIRGADRIVVLDEGRIVEQGTFAELWEREGHFTKMLSSQHTQTMGSESEYSRLQAVGMN